ncbi:integral membrane protein [Verticillium alfalfae VaMs.102]|uniref:Integral membrane protein n=1 Tax=Verticillium alfalfae (strain VaMs.102 / ATCC MYA-4576 / FGSC 10136) TaxID=526221 RepID=C9SDD1_VERA1|nr:integral membrane protein [Verticillium alfalfae VaMs.102]EEY17083.1 integral membrane protein [Verticillium alfalfae VaMs.102]
MRLVHPGHHSHLTRQSNNQRDHDKDWAWLNLIPSTFRSGREASRSQVPDSPRCHRAPPPEPDLSVHVDHPSSKHIQLALGRPLAISSMRGRALSVSHLSLYHIAKNPLVATVHSSLSRSTIDENGQPVVNGPNLLTRAGNMASSDSEPSRQLGYLPPPPGVTPDFDHPRDAGRVVVLAGLIVCNVLVTIFVSLRGYVKVFVNRRILLADLIHYGLGHYAWEVTVENYSEVLKWLYASSIVYIPAAYLTKVTLLLLIARVFAVNERVAKGIHWFLWALLLLYTPVQTIKIIICVPINSYWDFSVSGRCINQRRVFIVDLSIAVMAGPRYYHPPHPDDLVAEPASEKENQDHPSCLGAARCRNSRHHLPLDQGSPVRRLQGRNSRLWRSWLDDASSVLASLRQSPSSNGRCKPLRRTSATALEPAVTDVALVGHGHGSGQLTHSPDNTSQTPATGLVADCHD